MNAELVKAEGFEGARGKFRDAPDVITFEVSAFDFSRSQVNEIADAYMLFKHEAIAHGYRVAHWEDFMRNVVCFRLERECPAPAPAAVPNPLRSGAIDV